MLFTRLSAQNQNEFYEKTPTESAKFLAEAIGCPLFRDDTRQSVRLDVALRGLRRCHELGLHPSQINAVFDLGQQVLDKIAGGEAEPVDVEGLIKSYLVDRTKASPQLEKGEFLPEDAGRIGRLMMEDFIVHLALYRFVLTVDQEREVWKEAVDIERPFSIALNLNAVTIEEFEKEKDTSKHAPANAEGTAETEAPKAE